MIPAPHLQALVVVSGAMSIASANGSPLDSPGNV